MYDQISQSRLIEKIGYELWYLNYIAKTLYIFEGGDSLTTVELFKDGQDKVNVYIECSDVLGVGNAMEIVESISPLTFISSFKIIDMIIEWILEENYDVGNIKKVPWKFVEKIDVIKHQRILFPPLMQSISYLKDYLVAIYDNLTKFRNEIIHNHNFSVSGDKLRINPDNKSISNVLEIDKVQLGAFVRLSVAYANLLAGTLNFGWKEEALIKYNLDRIATFHRLNEFKKEIPIEISVIYNVTQEEGVFSIDLKLIRERLKRIHPVTTIVFNLKVIGYENEVPVMSWQFPVESIPSSDCLVLAQSDFKNYRL